MDSLIDKVSGPINAVAPRSYTRFVKSFYPDWLVVDGVSVRPLARHMLTKLMSLRLRSWRKYLTRFRHGRERALRLWTIWCATVLLVLIHPVTIIIIALRIFVALLTVCKRNGQETNLHKVHVRIFPIIVILHVHRQQAMESRATMVASVLLAIFVLKVSLPKRLFWLS